MSELNWNVLSKPALEVAPRLLGSYLIRELDGHKLVGKIVEAEAYDQSDPASHSFYGNNGRAAVTFGASGHLYVHAIRQHFCCDITAGVTGHGASVLIRAVEPLEGLDAMRLLRHGISDSQLTNGPGKVCQALGIDKQLNGHDLRGAPLVLVLKEPLPADQIVRTTRVGITKAKAELWRFYIKDSPFVSKK